MKATWCQINGEPHDIFKSPKTDNGVKKSLKGLLQVRKVDNCITVKDCCTPQEEATGALETIFKDGELIVETSLAEIRRNVNQTFINE